MALLMALRKPLAAALRPLASQTIRGLALRSCRRAPIVDLSSKDGNSLRSETSVLSDVEEIRSTASHPRMSSLQISAVKRTAILRRKQVQVEIPLVHFREKLRSFGWEAENCHQPILLFGDDQQEVQRAHSILIEEGFTSVSNAQTREAVVRALKRPPTHLRQQKDASQS
mmetsp:Transcript_79859/g.191739  ORF Transcript_79859/g.191739 Transcript_79859/m.191739 type:complete len:170 (+) Transcript_79859:86-595(+)